MAAIFDAARPLDAAATEWSPQRMIMRQARLSALLPCMTSGFDGLREVLMPVSHRVPHLVYLPVLSTRYRRLPICQDIASPHTSGSPCGRQVCAAVGRWRLVRPYRTYAHHDEPRRRTPGNCKAVRGGDLAGGPVAGGRLRLRIATRRGGQHRQG